MGHLHAKKKASIPYQGNLPCHVALGGLFEGCAYGSNSWIFWSLPQVSNFLSRVHVIPFTMFSCACACHFSSRVVESHTFTIPSPLPEAKCSRLLGSWQRLYTPSTCPGVKSARNGFANMRSIFVAFRARVYSRARSNGCWLGSRFRVSLFTLEPGACADEADRDNALIFIVGVCNLGGGFAWRSRLRWGRGFQLESAVDCRAVADYRWCCIATTSISFAAIATFEKLCQAQMLFSSGAGDKF